MELVELQRYEKVLDRLIAYAEERGVTVIWDEKKKGGEYSISTKTITLDFRHVPAQVVTLAHEIGHALEFHEQRVNIPLLKNVQYNIIAEMATWTRAYQVLVDIDAEWCFDHRFVNTMVLSLNSYHQIAANLNDEEWQEAVESYHIIIQPYRRQAFHNAGVRAW